MVTSLFGTGLGSTYELRRLQSVLDAHRAHYVPGIYWFAFKENEKQGVFFFLIKKFFQNKKTFSEYKMILLLCENANNYRKV